MSIEKLVESVTPELYKNMQKAIATGKWPNGVEVTSEQRENCLQVVIAYDELHKNTEDRVGYLPTKPQRSTTASLKNQDLKELPITILKD